MAMAKEVPDLWPAGHPSNPHRTVDSPDLGRIKMGLPAQRAAAARAAKAAKRELAAKAAEQEKLEQSAAKAEAPAEKRAEAAAQEQLKGQHSK
jgi:hypothetical protein